MTDYVEKIISETLGVHIELVDKMRRDSAGKIAESADIIIRALSNGGTVYICGNGGSAADAQHIAAEFVGRFKIERKALPAIALTTNTSIITSIANDYKYDDIFVRQVEAFVGSKDVFWAISTSGFSANVVAAAELAGAKGASIIAFTGKESSKLEKLAHVCFCAGHDSTARAQEVHQLAYHIICELVEQDMAGS